MIHHADCLTVMADMEPESVDAIVTDPPYDLTSTGARKGSPRVPGTGPYSRGFMGKSWDGTGIAFRPETWAAAFRVARPSAYLLAFGGTRTVHRMATAIEDAGWLIRDMLVWAYASGFPKSKASLKPAWEPIVMARKPGPLRMLAIDACRIPTDEAIAPFGTPRTSSGGLLNETIAPRDRFEQSPAGRWPANVILTDPIFDGGVEGVLGGGDTASGKMMPTESRGVGRVVFGQGLAGYTTTETYGDAGTYSRFFLIPKADRADREPAIAGARVEARTMGRGLTGVSGDRSGGWRQREADRGGASQRANHHPTVKPTELMRHLVRLVTPPRGIVLDPFLGSGTTAIAAELEGFDWIGIEKEAEYVAIAEARLQGTQRGMGLSA